MGKSKFYAEQELHFQLVAVLHAKDEEPFKLTWYEQESSTDTGLFIYYLKIKTLKQKLSFSFICTAGPPTPIMSHCLAQSPALSMVQGAAGEPHYAHKRHAQQIEILPCTVSMGRPTFVKDWFCLHSHMPTVSDTVARHDETNELELEQRGALIPPLV